MSVEAAHKLIVLARQVAAAGADLGVMAGTLHEGGDEELLRRELMAVRLRLEGLAASIGKVYGGEPE